MLSDRIDGVAMDTDEDGLHLILSGERAEYRFHIQGVLEELYRAVRADVWPYLYERDAAKMRAVVFRCDPDESGGYDADDPKHPRYHSTRADTWDMREGK